MYVASQSIKLCSNCYIRVSFMEFVFEGVIKEKKDSITPLTTHIQTGRDHKFPKGTSCMNLYYEGLHIGRLVKF